MTVFIVLEAGEGEALCLHAVRKIIIYLNSHFSSPTLKLLSVTAAPLGLWPQRRERSASVSGFPLQGGVGVKGTAQSPSGSAMRLRLSLANA